MVTWRDGVNEAARIHTDRLCPPKHDDPLMRMRWIKDELGDWLPRERQTWANVEGPAFASKFGRPHERAGVYWFIQDVLAGLYIPRSQMSPTGVKMYATNNGGANKDDVLAAAFHRLPGFNGNNDEADAAWLAAALADKLTNGRIRWVPKAQSERAMKGGTWDV